MATAPAAQTEPGCAGECRWVVMDSWVRPFIYGVRIAFLRMGISNGLRGIDETSHKRPEPIWLITLSPNNSKPAIQ